MYLYVSIVCLLTVIYCRQNRLLLARIQALINYLAHSANLLEGLYILLALISFFFFFNDHSKNNYLKICWTNFHNFSPSDRLVVDDRSGSLFPIPQGTLPWQPILGNFGLNWQITFIRHAGVWKRIGVRQFQFKRFDGNIVHTSCANLIKIGPVSQRLRG